jgi:hypothetical protein
MRKKVIAEAVSNDITPEGWTYRWNDRIISPGRVPETGPRTSDVGGRTGETGQGLTRKLQRNDPKILDQKN